MSLMDFHEAAQAYCSAKIKSGEEHQINEPSDYTSDNTQCHRSHQTPPTNQPQRQEKPRSKYGETVAPTHRGNTVTKTVVHEQINVKSDVDRSEIEDQITSLRNATISKNK